ncbi:MAG: acetyl-CoA carboxylase carboxyltransferase subunit alpha [Candidatus Margulisbacteria bacterium]|nr:acetyl-CoA carboxylase carboxyltransferase subunit alpha [Candidatus Margulisiibacteriota bacterium]
MQKEIILDFEKPILKLYEKINSLKALSEKSLIDLSEEINVLKAKVLKIKQDVYDNLRPDQIIKISRHPLRPTTLDYISLIFTDFVELHGDRCFGDDPAIVGGFSRINGQKIAVIGHQKGKDTKDNIYRNFGMPQPEGYRKALRIMQLAEKLSMPVITFVDTPGAFPGIEAEKHGQAEAIARNLKEMSALKVPVLSLITGEGGSGGALGIAVANEVLILEFAVYSVISPEGCAAILFNDAKRSAEAAVALKITAPELIKLKVVDGIVSEPPGGAHLNPEAMAETMKTTILNSLEKYKKLSPEKIRQERFKKFRAFGFFEEK